MPRWFHGGALMLSPGSQGSSKDGRRHTTQQADRAWTNVSTCEGPSSSSMSSGRQQPGVLALLTVATQTSSG
eukprot:6253605-Alexandrium_andersonii.AAC.1